MILQEKNGSIWEAHQIQILPVQAWRYASMGCKLLGDLTPSGQLDVCWIHAYPNHYQRASHQVTRFCYGLQSG